MNERVVDLAKGFRKFWSDRLSSYPKYRLDLTWPSVAVVDMILAPARGRDLSAEEDEVVLAASAYLACILHDCWSNFGGEFTVTISAKEEIILEGRGGAYLREEEKITLPLSRVVKEVLHNPPDPFQFYEKTALPLSQLQNLLSPLMLGLCTGLSPFIDGPWKRMKDSALGENIQQTNALLAKGTADHYLYLYPTETLGADPQLASCNLIFPPLSHCEPAPGILALSTLAKFFTQEQTPLEDQRALALNLCQLPDPQISTIGFLLGAALCDGPAPEKLLYAAQCRKTAPLLPSVGVGQRLFGRAIDWAKCLEEGDEKTVQQGVALYRSLGLLPLLRVEPLELSDPLYRPLLGGLLTNDLAAASEASDLLLEGLSLSAPPIWFQAIALDLAAGRLEEADGRMKYLLHSGLADDYTAHERARLLELSATLHLTLQNFGDALPQFQEALRLGLADLPVFITASLSTAMLLIGKGDLEDALTTTDSLLARAPHSLDGHLVRHLLLRQLNRRDESDSTLPTLAAAAPGHYGIFQLLLESILS